MMRAPSTPGSQTEGLRADLAAATYRVAKRHGFKRAFIDIEMDLWDAQHAARTLPLNDEHAASSANLDRVA